MIENGTLSAGRQQFHLEACRSGDLEYFLGVDMADRDGKALVRLVIDPMDGPRLKVVLRTDEGPESFVLTRDQCRQLEAQVEPTGWRINTVRDFSGFIDAECGRGGASPVSLHVRFSHCH